MTSAACSPRARSMCSLVEGARQGPAHRSRSAAPGSSTSPSPLSTIDLAGAVDHVQGRSLPRHRHGHPTRSVRSPLALAHGEPPRRQPRARPSCSCRTWTGRSASLRQRRAWFPIGGIPSSERASRTEHHALPPPGPRQPPPARQHLQQGQHRPLRAGSLRTGHLPVTEQLPREHRERRDKLVARSTRKGVRVVYGYGLENRRDRKVTVGSNPTPSASSDGCRWAAFGRRNGVIHQMSLFVILR